MIGNLFREDVTLIPDCYKRVIEKSVELSKHKN